MFSVYSFEGFVKVKPQLTIVLSFQSYERQLRHSTAA